MPVMVSAAQDTVWSVLPWVHTVGTHPPYLIGTAFRIAPFIAGSLISYGVRT